MNNKEYFVIVDGEKVTVTEEVYRAYMQPVWREERNTRNRWRCRDARGVRCKGACLRCEIARIGNGATGNDLSLERMVEDEDPEFATVPDVADVVIMREQISNIMDAVSRMSKTDQKIISMLIDGFNQYECAAELGIAQPTVNNHISRIRKKLKVFLK